MPLLAARLSAAMRAALLGNTDAQAVDNPALTALCDVIAGAVVDEIQANAAINPLGLLAPAGVAGGPVTGTATIL